MRYIADTVDFELKEPTVVTLGKFDGRHRGHQKLLRTMEEVKGKPGLCNCYFYIQYCSSYSCNRRNSHCDHYK